MIVNGKLHTIFDEIEHKPLPEKEECSMVEKNEVLAKEKQELKIGLTDLVSFIDTKYPNASNKAKQYLMRLCVKYYKK